MQQTLKLKPVEPYKAKGIKERTVVLRKEKEIMKKLITKLKKIKQKKIKVLMLMGTEYQYQNHNLSAQIIDDRQRKTLVSASSIEKEIKSKKVKKMEKSSLIGEY